MKAFVNTLPDRIHQLDWSTMRQQLFAEGYTLASGVLSQEVCQEIIAWYPKPDLFRKTIRMEQFRFGQGEYKYFSNPLPDIIQSMREHLYAHLASTANRYKKALQMDIVYPATLAEFLVHCHQQDQARPTPLLLKYEKEGYNALHQDLYGAVYFPFQAVCFLSEPGRDYTGGEFVLLEQRPRAQSRAEVLIPWQGDLLIFTTHHRPVKGTRGYYKVAMKHGVSRVRTGNRFTLGIIFHDAA